jgi:hypothetical protein
VDDVQPGHLPGYGRGSRRRHRVPGAASLFNHLCERVQMIPV